MNANKIIYSSIYVKRGEEEQMHAEIEMKFTMTIQ